MSLPLLQLLPARHSHLDLASRLLRAGGGVCWQSEGCALENPQGLAVTSPVTSPLCVAHPLQAVFRTSMRGLVHQNTANALQRTAPKVPPATGTATIPCQKHAQSQDALSTMSP